MNETSMILVRSILAFVILFIVARILGKKQISQLTFFDYVVGISIGTMAASLAIDSSLKITNALIGFLVFLIIPLLMALGSIKSFKLRGIFEGSPTVLIENGKVLEKNLMKVKFTFDDLMSQLREKNVFKLADVEIACLESNGKLSVMKKSESRPVTPKDLGLLMAPEHRPSLVIIDGSVIGKNLQKYGFTEEALLAEIKKQGAQNYDDVFLAQIDSNGNLYVDLYDDASPISQQKQAPLIAAQLRKIQTDIETIAMQTRDPQEQSNYYQQANELQNLITKINPNLQSNV